MTQEQWLTFYLKRRIAIERGGWIALLLVLAVVNTVTICMDMRRLNLSFQDWEVATWELSSAVMWMLLIPWMIRGADAKPLRWGLWRRHLPWHVLFSLVTSLVHVVGMVTMRKAVYALQGSSYDFGSWPKELVYEALKDVRSYAFILTIVGAYRLLLWRWQGEASLLSEPPQASQAITSSTTPPSSRPMDLLMPPAPPDRQPEPAPVTPLQLQPQPQPPPQLPQVDRPERLLVKKLGKEFLLPVDEIEWVQACGNYVNLHRQQHDYPLRSSLSAFEQRLDPAQFVRVHRSYLVRLGLIASIEPTDAGDAHLHLRDGSRLPASRTYLEALRKRLV